MKAGISCFFVVSLKLKSRADMLFSEYSQFLKFGMFIFGRGGNNNAQSTKSYFRLFKFGSGTLWEWPVCEI